MVDKPDTIPFEQEIDRKIDKILEKQKDAERWDVILAVIVAILGFAGWKAQSTIQEHIDQSAREVTTRLAITQQFYSRKLSTYEDVHRQMANLVSALKDARFNPQLKKLPPILCITFISPTLSIAFT